MSAHMQVKIVVEIGGKRWPVHLSRVPCIDESILIKNVLYDVSEVVHHTNGDETAAEITVSLPTVR